MEQLAALPASVRASHPDWEARVVWTNEVGGVTWLLLDGPERRFCKRTPIGTSPRLADERDRLIWAGDRLPVARVLDYGATETEEWLLLSAVPGRDATRVALEPSVVVPMLGEGLRAFHETSADDCPFDFSLTPALAHVQRRLAHGLIDPAKHFHEEFASLSAVDAFGVLEQTRPATEDLVLCHGDYCFPNVMIDGEKVTGYLDLGELGIADRWWDVAVGAWSVTWNVGPGYEDLFMRAYGIEPDLDRLRYYRLLYDMAS